MTFTRTVRRTLTLFALTAGVSACGDGDGPSRANPTVDPMGSGVAPAGAGAVVEARTFQGRIVVGTTPLITNVPSR